MHSTTTVQLPFTGGPHSSGTCVGTATWQTGTCGGWRRAHGRNTRASVNAACVCLPCLLYY